MRLPLRRLLIAAILPVVLVLSLLGCDDDGGGVTTAPPAEPGDVDGREGAGDGGEAPDAGASPAQGGGSPGADPSPAQGGGSPPEGDDVEQEMARLVFDLVNDERSERGLEPLQWDDQLAELARGWSQEMAEEGQLEHQDPEVMLERSEGFTAVGENIFQATGPVPASTIHVGWMRSEAHRRNVLSPDFDHLGVGFVCTDDGGLWATQRFGGTDLTAPPGPDEEPPPEEPIVAAEGQGPSCPGGPLSGIGG